MNLPKPAAAERLLPQRMNLVGRRVLVTGAAGGIGQSAAVCLAQLGADLVLTDVGAMASTRERCLRHGASCELVQGDLLDPGFLDSLVARGPYFALACVAGVVDRRSGMDDLEAFDYILRVNLWAPMMLARACIEQMKAQNVGYVVLVGSGAGRNGGSAASDSVDYASYASSKGGVHTLVRWLSRRAVGSNVLVNGVAPGPIDTGFGGGAVKAVPKAALSMGRLGAADEAGWPIALLCSPIASFISGAILDVNGGAFVG